MSSSSTDTTYYSTMTPPLGRRCSLETTQIADESINTPIKSDNDYADKEFFDEIRVRAEKLLQRGRRISFEGTQIDDVESINASIKSGSRREEPHAHADDADSFFDEIRVRAKLRRRSINTSFKSAIRRDEPDAHADADKEFDEIRDRAQKLLQRANIAVEERPKEDCGSTITSASSKEQKQQQGGMQSPNILRFSTIPKTVSLLNSQFPLELQTMKAEVDGWKNRYVVMEKRKEDLVERIGELHIKCQQLEKQVGSSSKPLQPIHALSAKKEDRAQKRRARIILLAERAARLETLGPKLMESHGHSDDDMDVQDDDEVNAADDDGVKDAIEVKDVVQVVVSKGKKSAKMHRISKKLTTVCQSVVGTSASRMRKGSIRALALTLPDLLSGQDEARQDIEARLSTSDASFM